MKKVTKVTLWVLAVLASVLLILLVFYYFSYRSATRKMHPAETAAVNDSVWVVKDKFVNAYIFKGRDGYLMVDAGIGRRNFKREIKKTGIRPRDITAIVLTHTDGDHIGGVAFCKNAAVYMHTDEKQMIDGTTGKTRYSKQVWKYGAYNLFESNTTIYLDGIKVSVIHTPGHTPGSACYIIGDDYFATGDNLIYKDGEYLPFIERFNMDTKQQLESIKSLPSPESFKYILTSHYGYVKIEK